jgi:spermidine synthase
MTRFAALLLTLLTGFSGLVYEVAWQKYLATLLGSHAEATAAVLAIFLGGLAVGYALFGSATRRLAQRAHRSGHSPRLLLFYSGVEAGIGLYALAFPALFGWIQSISLLVPLHAGLGFAFDVLLTVALIGPPAVLMGGTIPILTLALAGDLQHATRIHAWVYGFNTLGAFAGALAGGFFLVPLLGLDGVLYAMGGLNLCAGAAFALLDRFGARVAPDLVAGEESPGAPKGFAGYAAVACLGGFSMMAVQTTLNRIGGLALGASHFTFAMVVAVFVLCIALGSLAVSLLSKIPPLVIVGSQWLLVLLLSWIYFALPDTPYYAHALRMIFRNDPASFYPFHFAVFISALAFLVLPIGLSGALLPLLFHHLRREVGTLGAVAGRLYSWNTLGSLVGALLGGYVLLFWLDLQQVYSIALAALMLGAATLTVLVLRISPIAVGVFVVLLAFLGLAAMPDWDRERLAAGTFRVREPLAATFSGPDAFFARGEDAKIIFHVDDPTSTITVRENKRQEGRLNLSLFTNGKSDGNSVFDYATMGLVALVPALLAENLERCFVIGYGLGITTGELAALEGTREVRVAEISQGVIDAAPLFDEASLGASHAPKVRIQRSDAYRALVRSEGKWDIVASEPSNPWVTGVEMLYSLEFLQVVRERLAPGGVFAQWFHIYELDRKTAELVLRNYAAAFSHVSLWLTMANDVLLVAFDRPERALDIDALEARFRRPDFSAGFARAGIEDFRALLAHEQIPLGTLQAADLRGELHTLLHPILSHHAARAFFRGGAVAIPKFVKPRSTRIGAQNSLLRRAAERGGRIPEDALEPIARELCRVSFAMDCATVLARWRHDYPGSARLSSALAWARKLPSSDNPRRSSNRRAAETILADAKLAVLEQLFGADDASAARPVARAKKLTTNYVRHYNYALPFDRGVLERAWARCTGAPCAAALRRAEKRLGPLDSRARRRPAGRPPRDAE